VYVIFTHEETSHAASIFTLKMEAAWPSKMLVSHMVSEPRRP